LSSEEEEEEEGPGMSFIPRGRVIELRGRRGRGGREGSQDEDRFQVQVADAHEDRDRSPVARDENETNPVDEEEQEGRHHEAMMEEEHEEDQGSQVPRRRLRLSHRAVNTLAQSLNPNNFVALPIPVAYKEYKVVMEKAKPTQGVAEKSISWVNSKRAQTGRQGAENRIRVEGGVKEEFRGVETPLEAFKLFYTDHIMDQIVLNSNRKFDTFVAGLTPEVKARHNIGPEGHGKGKFNYLRGVTREDVMAYIGLHFCRGAWQLNFFTYTKIWRRDIAVPVFPITMSRQRYTVHNTQYTIV
jgi:hypothetical protein